MKKVISRKEALKNLKLLMTGLLTGVIFLTSCKLDQKITTDSSSYNSGNPGTTITDVNGETIVIDPTTMTDINGSVISTNPTETTVVEDLRADYVFDLKNFDTVITRTGEQYSIEDCVFLEDGKVLITTDYGTDTGIVAYLDNLELYNTNLDLSIEYKDDESFKSSGYYNYFEYLRVEDNRKLIREEQALINAYDVKIGNIDCVILRYQDINGNLVEKIVKKDSIILKNKVLDSTTIENNYGEALSIDEAYDAYKSYYPEDKNLETYTEVKAYLDQETERAYFIGTNKDGEQIEMNMPISKIALKSNTKIDIPETAVDMGINVEGVYTQIYFQNYSSPTYGKEIDKAYIDKDMIYITYKDSEQMTITHVDGTQIVDPMNNQLRTCFELEELELKRGMYYNLPQREHLGTGGNGNKTLNIGENYFYFMTIGGGVSYLVSTRQFNFTTSIKSDLDNGVYPEELIDLPQEVEVTNYIQGVESEKEKEVKSFRSEVGKYRYFEDYNHNPYIECRSFVYNLDDGSLYAEAADSTIYPAEQFVFNGINLTKFKTEGVPIFDLSQDIDEVSINNGISK